MILPRRARRVCSLAAVVLPAAALLVPVAVSSAATRPSRTVRPDQTASLRPGDLLVSSSTYPGPRVDITAGSTPLPPNCGTGPNNDGPCATASADGSQYPQVFDNAGVDGSFGIASPIVLNELDPQGHLVGTLPVPAPRDGTDGVVTSFSSKSELSLELSPDGKTVSFMGYDAPVGAVDVSNSDTPGIDVPSANPATQGYDRVVAELGPDGTFHYTLTNAFSGDNGRAAILNSADNVLYMAGNADDASGTNFIQSTGAQITAPSTEPESAQAPVAPTPVGSFATAQLGDTETKDVAKDNNYRSVAIDNNVLYFTKGSGGKGINAVYFVDTTGTACPDSGVGVPQAGATLPTGELDNGAFTLAAEQPPTPTNMCLLAGFSQVLNHDNPIASYPFGMWFATPDTLYVADEGNGNGPTASGDYSAAGPVDNPTAGVQKWIFDPSAQAWHLAYTLQTGLDLGQPYQVPGYPAGVNAATGLPWAPATDGLRDITGRVNPDGTVTIYGVTSTVSGSGDQGADPNRVVAVTDQVGATSQPGGEQFRTLQAAPDGTIFRGVSFTPGTGATPGAPGAPSGHGGSGDSGGAGGLGGHRWGVPATDLRRVVPL